MPYRRTENVVRRLAARRQSILGAARAIAAEEGMVGVQIAPVAARAGIAAGTVYRYFPSKTELVEALVTTVAEAELAALHQAAEAAPGPLSALAAAVATFAARLMRERRLMFAVLAEPAEAELAVPRSAMAAALIAELETRAAAAIAVGHLPEQQPRLTACAIYGGLIEAMVGPRAPDPRDGAAMREQVQQATLLALRALGVADARARGLVVQTVIPPAEAAATN